MKASETNCTVQFGSVGSIRTGEMQMDAMGNPEDRDIFGNSNNSNVWGGPSQGNVYGDAPQDAWGNYAGDRANSGGEPGPGLFDAINDIFRSIFG